MGTLKEGLTKLPNRPGTFQVGDKVIWKETRSYLANKVKRFGMGPFTVIEVIPIRKEEQEGAEHHQLVVVTKPDGSLFYDGEDERNKFSGAWFVKVPASLFTTKDPQDSKS
jgi:hypothetical protein